MTQWASILAMQLGRKSLYRLKIVLSLTFTPKARERDATAYEKRMGQEMSIHLRELIAPHFLRRTKDILEKCKKNKAADDVTLDEVDGGSDKENEKKNG